MNTMLQATHCQECGKKMTRRQKMGLWRCDKCLQAKIVKFEKARAETWKYGNGTGKR